MHAQMICSDNENRSAAEKSSSHNNSRKSNLENEAYLIHDRARVQNTCLTIGFIIGSRIAIIYIPFNLVSYCSIKSIALVTHLEGQTQAPKYHINRERIWHDQP